MRKHGKRPYLLAFVATWALYAGAAALFGAETSVPKVDKPKLEIYLRYIEGYTAGVKLVIDDPTPSAYKGYSRVMVHVTLGTQKVGDRLYYVSPDGEQFFSGTLWNLNENPFVDTLEHLPIDGPSFGPASGRVTLVVFSDFECPYCREFARTMRANVPKKYPDDVRVVFEEFPIDSIHPWAHAAAEAAQCVADQKAAAFWVFHDWVFDHQGDVNAAYQHQKETFGTYLRDQTLAAVKEQNLDTAKLTSCIDTHAMASEVDEMVRAGRALQIQQTPTEFLNGRMVTGAVPWTTLDAIIQLEINRPKEIPAPNAAKCCEVTIPTVWKK